MGSLIGALYATGHSAEEIEEIATGAELPNIFHLSVDYDQLSYRRREDRRELPGAFEVGLKGGISMRNALLTDRGLNAFLHDELQNYDSDRLRFDELPIPFRCVSSDLNTLRRVVFYGGSMPLAVRASIAIPGIFAPVKYQGHYLVDGAIMENLPTEVAKYDLRSQVVIAVLLPSTEFADSDVDLPLARSLRQSGDSGRCAGIRRAAATPVGISPARRRVVCCTTPTTV